MRLLILTITLMAPTDNDAEHYPHLQHQRELEQLLSQYRFILNYTPAMLWTATADGQLDYVNGWMEQYYRYGR